MIRPVTAALLLVACSNTTQPQVQASINLLAGGHTVQGWLYPSPNGDTLRLALTGTNSQCVHWSSTNLPDSVVIDADVSAGNDHGHTHTTVNFHSFLAWEFIFTTSGSPPHAVSAFC